MVLNTIFMAPPGQEERERERQRAMENKSVMMLRRRIAPNEFLVELHPLPIICHPITVCRPYGHIVNCDCDDKIMYTLLSLSLYARSMPNKTNNNNTTNRRYH